MKLAIVMVIAYVLINTKPGEEERVSSAISKIEGMVEIYTLFGEYDMIVKLESKDYSGIENIVVRKIRTIPGVVDTKTLTTINA